MHLDNKWVFIKLTITLDNNYWCDTGTNPSRLPPLTPKALPPLVFLSPCNLVPKVLETQPGARSSEVTYQGAAPGASAYQDIPPQGR